MAARDAARPGGWTLDRVHELFPILAARAKVGAGLLSGGEQQMLSIGRALMTNPELLLMDEPSEGLSPMMVREVGRSVRNLADQGLTILLVEQNTPMALAIADHGYVLETGRVVKEGSAAELLADADIREFYLGAGESGRRSFRDVKTYRRKKRWSA